MGILTNNLLYGKFTCHKTLTKITMRTFHRYYSSCFSSYVSETIDEYAWHIFHFKNQKKATKIIF